MQVFRKECIFPGSPAFFAAFVKNSPILFSPRGARLYHTGSAGFLLSFIARKKGARVSSFLQDDDWRTLDSHELDSARFFGGERFWIKRSGKGVSLPCFRSSFCFPHQDLLSSDRIIFSCNISPLKSPTLISCTK